MPIQIICTGCQAKLKAPDTAAGKKIKCPKCQTVVSVPATPGENGALAKSSTAAGRLPTPTKPEQWFLQTPDGSQYGPVARDELDQWFSEGRVSPECQLLKQGSAQWQWAPELFPALSQLAATAASAGSVMHGGAPAAASPLTPLSSAGAFAGPLGSVSLGTPALSPLGSTYPSSATTLPSFTSGTAPTSSPFSSPAIGSANPYATSAAVGSYGGYGGYQPRSGPHPMVIVAGIFHILAGFWNGIVFIALAVLGFILLAGGGMAAAFGANAEEVEAQGAAGVLATVGVIGAVVLFLLAAVMLAYSIFQISTAIGLFRRRRWARVASFVFAGLGIVAMFFYLVGAVSLEPISILSLFFELAYVIVVFIAMCLPDATRDFR